MNFSFMLYSYTFQIFYLSDRFSVENEWNFSWRKAERSNFTTDYAAHSDQLYYIFRFSAYPDVFPDEAYQSLNENSFPWQIIKKLTNFYANFAKFK